MVDRNLKTRKWLGVTFFVIAAFFLKLQLSRLSEKRKPAINLNANMTKEEYQKAIEAKLRPRKTPLSSPSPAHQLNEPILAQGSMNLTPTPSVKASPLQAEPLESFTPQSLVVKNEIPLAPRTVNSKIFVYFFNGKNEIKGDLFYELFPDRVSDFIKAITKCHKLGDPSQRNVSLKKSGALKSLAPISLDYSSYIYSGKAAEKKGIVDVYLTANPYDALVTGTALIGGIVATGANPLEREAAPETNGELVSSYDLADVKITSLEGDDSPEILRKFRDVLSHVRDCTP